MDVVADFLALRKSKFLEAFEATRSVRASAEAVGVSARSIYRWREKDESFAKAMLDISAASLMVAEDELFTRAVYGWEEPVFFEGQQCGTIRKFSDSNLQFYLRANAPEKYGRRLQISGGMDLTKLTDEQIDERIAAAEKRFGLRDDLSDVL
ncbi:MAG: terminase [Burkholderiales bacterium]|nr:terminase [Burkholderiales bacterium]